MFGYPKYNLNMFGIGNKCALDTQITNNPMFIYFFRLLQPQVKLQ